MARICHMWPVGSDAALFVPVSLCFRLGESAVDPGLHGTFACHLNSSRAQEEVTLPGREATQAARNHESSPQPLAECPDQLKLM